VVCFSAPEYLLFPVERDLFVFPKTIVPPVLLASSNKSCGGAPAVLLSVLDSLKGSSFFQDTVRMPVPTVSCKAVMAGE